MKGLIKQVVMQAGFETLHFSGLTRLPGLAQPGLGVILTLHHVSPAPRPAFAPNGGLSITPDFLDAALSGIRARGYDLVSLAEVHRRLTSGETGNPFVAITLDDGYRNNRDVALPVFERHGAPFTLFVTTGFSEGTVLMWWETVERILRKEKALSFDFGAGPERVDISALPAKYAIWDRIRHWVTQTHPAKVIARIGALAEETGFDALALTRELVLAREEVVALARHPLATIGAHTLTHPNLKRLDEADARAEMTQGAECLAGWLGARPRFLAYPYGFPAAACPREFALARQAGFDLAVTTRPGMLFPDHAGHLTALPRVSLNGHFQAMRHLSVLMSGAPFMLRNRFRRLDVA